MKNNYIFLIPFLLYIATSHAITEKDKIKDDIIKNITNAYANLFGPTRYLFDKSIIETQNSNIGSWYEAISKAKNFVVENSKNLIDIKDSDLINAINKVEKSSMDLMNLIKISRGSTQNQGPIASRIEKEMTQLGDSIKRKFFALDNKKNAQLVIEAAAIYIASGANRAYKDITNPPAPTGLPPTLK